MFIKGADISSWIQMKDENKKLYDKSKEEKYIFDILKENGFNYIRLRLWNEPNNVKNSKGYCNLNDTILLAKEAKKYGFGIFLNFHYSDWWADPAQQNKPKAWSNLSPKELCQAVYEFTKNTLEIMKENEVAPQLIQIGNEIRNGMLFPDGAIPNWKHLSSFIQSGIKAVRDTLNKEQAKVVIHLDQGGRYYYLKEWFDNIISYGVNDFDIIAISYYPFWHGTFYELRSSIESLEKRYKRPILIAETAHAWRRSKKGFIGEEQETVAGFPATVQAQKTVLELIMNIIASVNNGLGVFYWEPFMFPEPNVGGWGENMGLIDEKGVVLDSIKAFNYLPKTKPNDEIIKVYEPKPLTILKGKEILYPDKVKVLTWEGKLLYKPVTWDLKNCKQAGKYIIKGKLKDNKEDVDLEVNIVESLDNKINYITNGSFDDGLEGWKVNKYDNDLKVEVRPEFNNPFPAPPEYFLYFEGKSNFNFELKRQIPIEDKGKYKLSVKYMGSNTTGVNVKLYLKTQNKEYNKIIYPSDEEWQQFAINNLNLDKSNIEIGISVNAPWIYGKITNFCLEKLNLD